MARNVEVRLLNEVSRAIIRHTQWYVDRFTMDNEVPKTYDELLEVCFQNDDQQFEDAIVAELMKNSGVVTSVDIALKQVQLVDGTVLTYAYILEKIKSLYEKNIIHRTANL